MDFGFGKSSKGSMKRKQSNTFLQSLGRGSSARASAIPFPSPQSSTYQASASSQAYQTPPLPHSPAFASPTATINDPYDRGPNPYAHGTGNAFQSPDTYPDGTSSYSYAPGITRQRTTSGTGLTGRIVSGSNLFGRGTTAAESVRAPNGNNAASAGQNPVLERTSDSVKKPEDVLWVIKDRLFSWSYMMQWYQGDVHWFNTVQIEPAALEAHLGARLDARSRLFLVLGASLGKLFEIAEMTDFLKSLLRLMEEWEILCEGGSRGMRRLLRSQRGKRDASEPESLLTQINLPFSPDFFQTHASTCSVIRDVYKKILGMILPRDTTFPTDPAGRFSLRQLPSSSDPLQSLFHQATYIHTAPIEVVAAVSPSINFNPLIFNPNHNTGSNGHAPNGSEVLSPIVTPGMTGYQTPTATQHSRQNSNSRAATPFGDALGTVGGASAANGVGDSKAVGGGGIPFRAIQHDGFQALLAGDLPGNMTLVGDGQVLTSQTLEMFVKVDAKFRKHFSILIREGDAIARTTLDQEIAAVMASLTSADPMNFDLELGIGEYEYEYDQAPLRPLASRSDSGHSSQQYQSFHTHGNGNGNGYSNDDRYSYGQAQSQNGHGQDFSQPLSSTSTTSAHSYPHHILIPDNASAQTSLAGAGLGPGVGAGAGGYRRGSHSSAGGGSISGSTNDHQSLNTGVGTGGRLSSSQMGDPVHSRSNSRQSQMSYSNQSHQVQSHQPHHLYSQGTGTEEMRDHQPHHLYLRGTGTEEVRDHQPHHLYSHGTGTEEMRDEDPREAIVGR